MDPRLRPLPEEPEPVERDGDGSAHVAARTAAHSATRPNGASKTNTPLTSREMRTFCFMSPSAARESLTASASFGRSSRMRATSAVSSAASVPAAPIAKPTEEAASAGASFTPSPTIPAEPCFSTSRAPPRPSAPGAAAPCVAHGLRHPARRRLRVPREHDDLPDPGRPDRGGAHKEVHVQLPRPQPGHCRPEDGQSSDKHRGRVSPHRRNLRSSRKREGEPDQEQGRRRAGERRPPRSPEGRNLRPFGSGYAVARTLDGPLDLLHRETRVVLGVEPAGREVHRGPTHPRQGGHPLLRGRGATGAVHALDPHHRAFEFANRVGRRRGNLGLS